MSGQNDHCTPEEDGSSTLAGKLMSRENMLRLIVFAGIAGILLIFCSSFFGNKTEKAALTDTAAAVSESESAWQYKMQLTEELGNMLAGMDGVGRTRVMVTIDSTARNIYATEEDYLKKENSRSADGDESTAAESSEKKNLIVVRQSDGSEQALIIGRLVPAVKGVLVVCDGGGDEEICARVTRAVSSALNITSSHICVVKMEA